jgi:dihydroneopterin aldolase
VDVEVEADLQIPASSDKLADTVDYVHVHRIVIEEMKLRSKLLEHVALRIIRRILNELAQVNVATVTVSKINPPIGGDVDRVSVQMKEHRA